jgi:hypothetical protein
MRIDIRALALAGFTALGRQNEEKAVYLLQSLLLDEKACQLRIAWLRQVARQVRGRFPDLAPCPRPEFLRRVLDAVEDPGIIAAWRQGKVTFAELEAMTRAPRALYEAHCRLLECEAEPWPGEEEDMVTEVEVSAAPSDLMTEGVVGEGDSVEGMLGSRSAAGNGAPRSEAMPDEVGGEQRVLDGGQRQRGG